MNLSNPLVTVAIPTYNSALSLQLCLESVSNQIYSNIEVLILDGGSSDETSLIVSKYKASFFQVGKGLLRARVEGVHRAQGEYIFVLDSDQILYPDTISRAVELMKKDNDMLVFGEDVYQKNTFVEKLFSYDRAIINTQTDLDPFSGVMLPRFFRTSLIREAIKNIPVSVLDTGDRDHAILYYETSLLSKKISIVPDALRHIEPKNIVPLVKKFYRWGKTNLFAHHPRYAELLKRKEAFRKGLFSKGLFIESIGSIVLLLLKGIPYKIGYYIAWLQKKI